MAGLPSSAYWHFTKGSMASNPGTLGFKGPYKLPGKGSVNCPLQQSTDMYGHQCLLMVVPHEIPVRPHLASSKADGTK